jgi:hypothetical protein
MLRGLRMLATLVTAPRFSSRTEEVKGLAAEWLTPIGTGAAMAEAKNNSMNDGGELHTVFDLKCGTWKYPSKLEGGL